jgi:hypothetical protein
VKAKLAKYEGNPDVVIAIPDMIEFDIDNSFDFIVLGSIQVRKVIVYIPHCEMVISSK